MQNKQLSAIEKRIKQIKQELQTIHEMRPGSLTCQYHNPKEKTGAYYQLSYTMREEHLEACRNSAKRLWGLGKGNITILIGLFAVGPVVAEEDTTTNNLQTTCPVMGGKINKEVYTDYKGERIYFCCEGCISEFQKDPAKYIEKVENEGATLEKTPEAVSNKESSPGTDASGKQSSACGDCGCDS